MISGLTLKTLPNEQRILGIESCIFLALLVNQQVLVKLQLAFGW